MKILFASKYFFYGKKQTKKATGTNPKLKDDNR